MKYQQLKKKTEGFTIIEVLIVLAIAGLILLIVFLAVPALQRNSRNTQMRNDVASVLGMISEFASNNNGKLPTDICSDANGNVGMVTTGTCSATNSKIGQVRAGTVVDLDATAPTDIGEINVATNNKCNGTGITSSNRSVAAQFRVENAGSSTGVAQCQES